MGYDIGAIEWKQNAEDGVDFQIKHPTLGPIVDDKGIPLTIKMGGAESSRIKAAVRERQSKRQAAIKAAGADPIEYTEEMRDADLVEDLVTLTLGWSDNWELDGKPFPFSKDNAVILYKRFPDVAEQAVIFASQRINFMQGSLKKS